MNRTFTLNRFLRKKKKLILTFHIFFPRKAVCGDHIVQKKTLEIGFINKQSE